MSDAAHPEPRKETRVESSSNLGSDNRFATSSDVDGVEAVRAEKTRALEARMKECQQRTMEELAETTSVTLRLKQKLESSGDSQLKIRKSRSEMPAVNGAALKTPPPLPAAAPVQPKPTGQKSRP